MNAKIVIDFDEYIAAVKLDGQWRLFREVMSMWILNYKAYDPKYDPSTSAMHWRENLLQVDSSNAREYCDAMTAKELLPSQIPYTYTEHGTQAQLTFVVNFDEKIYVNGMGDNVLLEDYVPADWHSLEDNPYNYVPAELRSLWSE